MNIMIVQRNDSPQFADRMNQILPKGMKLFTSIHLKFLVVLLSESYR
jgi:hypothetical protein